jgi:hypothetical protein
MKHSSSSTLMHPNHISSIGYIATGDIFSPICHLTRRLANSTIIFFTEQLHLSSPLKAALDLPYQAMSFI